VTITIPRWAFIAAAVVVIAVAAFLIGRGSGGDSGSGGASAEALPCDQAHAREAVSHGQFADEVFQLGRIPADKQLLDVYQPKLIDCVDLTGDGQNEMVAQVLCCTSGAPFPWAIFKQQNGQWIPALIRTRSPSAKLTVTSAGVTESSPAYADDDPLCCPSGRREGTASWDVNQFNYKPATGTADRSIVLAGDTPESIGGFPLQTGKLQDSIATFGVPSSYSRNGGLCAAEWKDIGLVINFVNFGGANPCTEQGAVGNVIVGGLEAEQAGWRTPEGATVEASQDELLHLYPAMKPLSIDPAGFTPEFPGRLWGLVSRPSPIGGKSTVPSLAARLTEGRAVAYELYVGAGGE
jgi:hypothetical protein